MKNVYYDRETFVLVSIVATFGFIFSACTSLPCLLPRSYGVLLYELLTGGSVPYATFSNSDVRSKVAEGYRLPLPQGCPEELYKLMLRCWAQRPTDRPHFSEVLKDGVEPLQTKAAKYVCQHAG